MEDSKKPPIETAQDCIMRHVFVVAGLLFSGCSSTHVPPPYRPVSSEDDYHLGKACLEWKENSSDPMEGELAGWLDRYLDSKRRLLALSAAKGWPEPRLDTLEMWLRFRYHAEMSERLRKIKRDSAIIGSMCSVLKDPVRSGVRTFLREEVLYLTSGIHGYKAQEDPVRPMFSSQKSRQWRKILTEDIGIRPPQVDSIFSRIRDTCPPDSHSKSASGPTFNTPDYEAYVVQRLKRISTTLEGMETRFIDSINALSKALSDTIKNETKAIPESTVAAIASSLTVSRSDSGSASKPHIADNPAEGKDPKDPR